MYISDLNFEDVIRWKSPIARHNYYCAVFGRAKQKSYKAPSHECKQNKIPNQNKFTVRPFCYGQFCYGNLYKHPV